MCCMAQTTLESPASWKPSAPRSCCRHPPKSVSCFFRGQKAESLQWSSSSRLSRNAFGESGKHLEVGRRHFLKSHATVSASVRKRAVVTSTDGSRSYCDGDWHRPVAGADQRACRSLFCRRRSSQTSSESLKFWNRIFQPTLTNPERSD